MDTAAPLLLAFAIVFGPLIAFIAFASEKSTQRKKALSQREKALSQREQLLYRRERLLSDLTEQLSREHARTLMAKRRQLAVSDSYGNIDYTKFWQHLRYFVKNVILRDLRARGYEFEDIEANEQQMSVLAARVNDIAFATMGSTRGYDISAVVTGEDYENFCMVVLEDNGWRVERTPATGDQGADLIAHSDKRKVVLQCKYYNKPVGNRAVQEACAARGFCGANHAVVVSSARYTKSAEELAATNNVLLLHHDELPALRRLLNIPEHHHVACPHCAVMNRVPADKSSAAANCGKCHQPLLPAIN